MPLLWDRCSQQTQSSVDLRCMKVAIEIQKQAQQKKSAKEKAKVMAAALLPNGPDPEDHRLPPGGARPSGSWTGRTLRPCHNNAMVLVDIDSNEGKYSNASDIISKGKNNDHTQTNRKIQLNNDDNPSNEYCLNPEDTANFLKLASTLKLLLADSLNDQDIDEGDRLIREYNTELITVSPSLYLVVDLWLITKFIPALWSGSHQTKPPLLNTHHGIYSRFWACGQILDLHLQMIK